MLRLTDVRINTSYRPKIPTLNGIHIINSKVKVEINYVAISKNLWSLEKIF